MVKQKESQILKKSFYDLIRNPVVVIPSILLILMSIILSKISSTINDLMTNRSSLILFIWLALFTIVFFLAFSYFYSGLIQAGFISIRKKVSIKEIFQGSNKFFIKNFFVILTIILFYSLINGLVGLIAYTTGKYLNFSLQTATFFFYFLYFLGLVGFIVFLTYTSFFLVRYNPKSMLSFKKLLYISLPIIAIEVVLFYLISNFSIFYLFVLVLLTIFIVSAILILYKSIKESISFTAKNYIFTIIVIFVFFILTEVLGLIDKFLDWNYILPSEIISYLILYPLLTLILARAIEELK